MEPQRHTTSQDAVGRMTAMAVSKIKPKESGSRLAEDEGDMERVF